MHVFLGCPGFFRYDGVNEHIDYFFEQVSQVNQDQEGIEDFLLLYARCYEVSVTWILLHI